MEESNPDLCIYAEYLCPEEEVQPLNARKWVRNFLIIILAFLVATGALVIYLDPYFHYHAPLEGWNYELSDQRSQNDGITKQFDYNAIIIGTSTIENCRTSEFDEIFGVSSIKLPYPGGTFKEINDDLEAAFATHDDIEVVLRVLDYGLLVTDKDAMRYDMGDYPDYLYDSNPFNDIEYLYNQDVLLYHILPMLLDRISGVEGGITSFDDYGSSANDVCSWENALQGRTSFSAAEEQDHLTEDEITMLTENIEQNVIAIANEHPETTFYLFFAPYSAAWYGYLKEEGTLVEQFEAVEITARLILEQTDNIELYTFSLNTDLTFNLDNYKDKAHYSPDVNSMILNWIAEGEGRLTLDNLDEFIEQETQLYLNYDYNELIP